MRFIPTKMHAAMDYVAGILLAVVPLFWLGDPDVPPAAIWTPVVIGVLMLLQAMMTDYELSLTNMISVPAHLGMDALAGLVLAASPWLFGFADVVWIPHLVLGLVEIGAALTTQTHRSESVHHTGGPRATA